MLRALLLFLSLFLNVAAYSEQPCEQVDSHTIMLSGPVGPDMLECAEEMITDDITEVIVTSGGGEVFAGRSIGYLIGLKPRKLIVRLSCLSSCANYFVPAASEIELEAKSIIGLHGTPDPWTINKIRAEYVQTLNKKVENGEIEPWQRQLNFDLQRRRDALTLEEEAQFSYAFVVPPGWRMYRDIGENAESFVQHFENTENVELGVGMMIVEESMLSSCLPHVKATNFQSRLDETVFDKPLVWFALKMNGFYRSGPMTCAYWEAFSHPAKTPWKPSAKGTNPFSGLPGQ